MSQTIEATIVPAGSGPDINLMDRADTPAIWKSYSEKAAALIEQSKAIVVTDCSQVSLMKQADVLRKECKSVRCEIERKRKELTEGFVKQTKAINSEAGKLWDLFEAEEARLLDMATFAEREEARQKAELISERSEKIKAAGGNPDHYQLGTMEGDTFEMTVEGLVKQREDRLSAEKKAKEEADAKAKADAEERERVRLENERLRKEAEELLAAEKKAREELARAQAKALAEKLAAEQAAAKALREEQERAAAERAKAEAAALKERQEAEKARQAAEAHARAEREAIEEKARKEAASAAEAARKEREVIEAKATAERVAREKMEAELKAKLEAEEGAQIEAKLVAARAAARAAAAPDREKLEVFAAAVRALPVPELTTDAGKALAGKLASQTEKFAAWIIEQSAKL